MIVNVRQNNYNANDLDQFQVFPLGLCEEKGPCSSDVRQNGIDAHLEDIYTSSGEYQNISIEDQIEYSSGFSCLFTVLNVGAEIQCVANGNSEVLDVDRPRNRSTVNRQLKEFFGSLVTE